MENFDRNQATKYSFVTQDSNEDSRIKFIYKKRSGTSGVTGQLYESKLLSLVLFRALNDQNIAEFYLGNNLDDIGAFDDICLKFKSGNICVAAFIQAKHKDDPRKEGITDFDLESKKGDFSIQTYFDSFIKIKEKIENTKINIGEKNIDKMFTENFEDIEYYFIIYTPVGSKITKKTIIRPKNQINKIRNLISTHDEEDIFQIKFDKSDVDSLANCLIEKELSVITKALLDCVTSDMNKKKYCEETSKIINKYQDFLIPNVIEISQEVSGECYFAKINQNLLFCNSALHIKLREYIFENIVSDPMFDEEESENNLLSLLRSKCCDIRLLSNIIGKVVIFNKKRNILELTDSVPVRFAKYRKCLNKITVSKVNVIEAYYQAGKEKLLSMQFILPITFNLYHPSECDSNNCTELSDSLTYKADIFSEQKNIVKLFFNRLFFYTKEAKQDEVEVLLKKELHECNLNIYGKSDFSSAHSEAIYLKFHDNVQKWSMLQGHVYYLTKTCDFLKKSRRETIGIPQLTTLNFNCTYQLKKCSIKFKDEYINKLKVDSLPIGITTIVTKTKALTCIKLLQCLNTESCAFVDIQHITTLTVNEFQKLLDEIQSGDIDILVILYEIGFDVLRIITQITNRFHKKLLVVTDDITKIRNQFNNYVIDDMDNHLSNLTEETQKRLLESNKIIIQGIEVPLNSVIDNECKHLINGEILLKLINNERIIVGKSLQDEKYENVKDYYISRILSKNHRIRYSSDSTTEYFINNFNDIDNSIVVLTAEPGMGKSTLVSHLSVKTKTINPNIWIVRINLLDCCSEFLKWQEDHTEIDLKATIMLAFKSELINIKDKFDLEVKDGVLVLKSCNLKSNQLLNLEIIMHSYNKGNIIFIFDGFDEICPHYKNEAVKFIKNVIPENKYTQRHESLDSDEDDIEDHPKYLEYSNDVNLTGSDERDLENDSNIGNVTHKEQIRKIWITSRPYNDIIQTLKHEFGPLHQLEPLSVYERDIFYRNYLEANIKLHELSYEQFKNIEELFLYMSQFRRSYGQELQVLHISSVPLYSMFMVAVDYFHNAILQVPLNIDKEKLRNEWISGKELLTVLERCLGTLNELGQALQLEGIPLHMHIAANYFVNEIKTTVHKNAREKWDLNVNSFACYESFFETKFKTIRLEEKTKRYTSCPEERLVYEREKKEFVETHKKLAFYALFHKYLDFQQFISIESDSQIKAIIRKIEKGEEKTGLIYKIHNNVPRFIHLVFAEYFAFEYIVDLLKNYDNDIKRKTIDFLLNTLLLDGSVGVMTVFDHKLMHDEHLIIFLSDLDTRKYIFELLMAQNEMKESNFDSWSERYIEEKIKPSLLIALENGLLNIVMWLLSSLEGNLNNDNFSTFIELIGKHFFTSAALLNRDDIIVFALDKIRTIDSSIVCRVIGASGWPFYFRSNEDGALSSNEEILNNVHSDAKGMVSRYWYYDEDDREFRYTYMDSPNTKIKRLAIFRDKIQPLLFAHSYGELK